MMMKTYMLAGALATLAPAAWAAELKLRPYVGFDLTQIMADYQTYSEPGFSVSGDDLFDDNLTGVSPYVGMQLSEHIGVELSYLTTQTGEKKNILNTGLDTEVKMSGFAADVVGRLPLTGDQKLSLLGSAGLGHYTADLELTDGTTTVKDDTDDTAYRLGAGVQYQLTEHMGVRAMARYISVDFDDSTDNLITGSVGVNYRF